MLPTDPDWYASIVAKLCAVALVIDAAQMLYTRSDYGERGVSSWSILRLDNRWLTTGRLAELLARLFGPSGFVAMMAAQLVAAVWLLAAPLELALPPLVVLAAVRALFHMRHAYGGLDGSDQMNLIVLGSLVLYSVAPDAATRAACLLFIAAQSFLSYFVAGLAKLASPVWRRGDALAGVMLTDNYGNARLGRVMSRHRALGVASCWGVIAFECVAPFLVVGGVEGAVAFVTLAVLFHVGIAVVMGLNTFLWSFGAALPAVIYAAGLFSSGNPTS